MSERNNIDVDINFHISDINDIFNKFMKEGGVDESIFEQLGEKDSDLSDLLYQLQMEGDQSTLFANINELGAMMPLIKQLLAMSKTTEETDEKELNILDTTERSVNNILDLMKTLGKFLEEKVAITPAIQKEIAEALEVANKQELSFSNRIEMITQALKNTMALTGNISGDLLTDRSSIDFKLDDYQKEQMKFVLQDMEMFLVGGLEAIENIKSRKEKGLKTVTIGDIEKIEQMINEIFAMINDEETPLKLLSDLIRQDKIIKEFKDPEKKMMDNIAVDNLSVLNNIDAILEGINEMLNKQMNSLVEEFKQIVEAQKEMIGVIEKSFTKKAVIDPKSIKELSQQLDEGVISILESMFTQNDLSEIGEKLFQEMADAGLIRVAGEEELKIARLTMLLNSMINTVEVTLNTLLNRDDAPEGLKENIEAVHMMRDIIPKRVKNIMDKTGSEFVTGGGFTTDYELDTELITNLMMKTIGKLEEVSSKVSDYKFDDLMDLMVRRSKFMNLKADKIFEMLSIFSANLGVLDENEKNYMAMLADISNRTMSIKDQFNNMLDGVRGNLDMIKNITKLDF